MTDCPFVQDEPPANSSTYTHVKLREIEISLYNTGIIAVFTPANRAKEGYLLGGINPKHFDIEQCFLTYLG